MSRPLWFVLGIVTLAIAVPARGQGLLEAIGEAIADSVEDGGYDNGGYNDHNHNNFNDNHNHNNYYPNHNSNTHYHQVWDGDHWDYVPHTVPSRPNGNVVYPSYPSGNVVYPNTTVISPATTITAAVSSNALPYKGPGVTIALEEDEGGSVNYLIDGKESATIQAGQQQTLTSKGRYEIRFSRGKSDDGRDFGQARYTITEGNYHFKVTDKGWELLRDKEQPNLVTTQIQPASPAGIKTNALPPKTAPAAAAPPAATPVPAAAAAAPAAPAAAAAPAAVSPPAEPAAAAAPAANALPAAKAATVPAPPAAPSAGG